MIRVRYWRIWGPRISRNESRAVHAADCEAGSFIKFIMACKTCNREYNARTQDVHESSYGHQNFVPGDTLLIQPLAYATKCNARSLPHNGVGVNESSIQEGPEALHVWADEFRTAFDCNAECHHCRLAEGWVRRSHILCNDGMKRGEDERRRESGSKCVDGTERNLRNKR